MIDLWKHIVSAKERCGQCKEDQKLGQIAYDAKIHEAVIVNRLGAEAESASLIGMDHKGCKQKLRYVYGLCTVQRYFAGYGLGCKQLFQGDAQVSQLPQL